MGEKTQIDRLGPWRREGKPDDATVPYRTECGGGGGGGGALDRAVRQRPAGATGTSRSCMAGT